jgi:hypothetical protein
MSINPNFVVAPDADAETAGAISYWRLGGSVKLTGLSAAWVAAGLDAADLPSEPSDKIGLSRALRNLESATRKAIQIKGGDFAGGWGLVDVITTDGNVHTRQVLRAKRGEGSRELDIVVEPEYAHEDAYHHFGGSQTPVSVQLRQAYQRVRSELAATDVSAWLIDLARKVSAISLRESGGVYFIPRDEVARWEQISQVVASVSDGRHDVFRIPALQTAEAVEAILSSLEVEANDTIGAFEADLIKTGEDAIGARALKGRLRAADTLAAKLAKYEGLLGVKLDKIRESLETVKADLQAADWAIQAEKDKADENKNGTVAA